MPCWWLLHALLPSQGVDPLQDRLCAHRGSQARGKGGLAWVPTRVSLYLQHMGAHIGAHMCAATRGAGQAECEQLVDTFEDQVP